MRSFAIAPLNSSVLFLKQILQKTVNSDINAMDASRIFNGLINKIETSRLNYVIHYKTPFSATISIKNSFVKYFSETNMTMGCEKDDYPTQENFKLLEDLKFAQNQNQNLGENLKREEMKVKHLEDQLGLFREDLLNIKGNEIWLIPV